MRWRVWALAALAACLVGCPEYNLRPNTQIDVYFQEVRNVVDVLLVVDNSCSMIDEQEKLADNFQAFIDAFEGANVDYQIGVVTTDQEQEHHRGNLRCAADVVGTEVGPFTFTGGETDTLALAFEPDGEMVTHTFDWGLLEEYCTVDGDEATCSASLTADLISYYFSDAFAVSTQSDAVWITTETPCDSAYLEVGEGTMNEVLGLESGYAMSGVKIIDLDTANAARHFAANVHVGNRGSGWEKGLEGAYLALDPLEMPEGNVGFLRDDAALSIVFVSDEEDKSPWRVDDYLAAYYQVKSPLDGWEAYRDDTILDLSAVVGDIPDGCEQEIGGDVYPAQPGYRYIDLAQRTGGVYDSICNEDFSPMVQVLGLNISGLRSEFFLTRYPDEVTLEVKVDSSVYDEGWIYDCADNSVVFDDAHTPPGESTVEVSYTVIARPVEGTCGGAEDSP